VVRILRVDLVEELCRESLPLEALTAFLDRCQIYYVDSSRLLPTGPAPMMRWRKRLFSFMARNANAATDFFSIPPNRVVELGARIEF